MRDAQLPNQFRCQTSKPSDSFCSEWPTLRRLKPACPFPKDSPEGLGQTCFLIAASCAGGDQEASNKFLVELSGIEPLTSCLQSTRSPN